MNAAHLQPYLLTGRWVVVYQQEDGARRASAPLPYYEALGLLHRFNHDLHRRMKTRRTLP
jgi:hypothetical protein